MGGGLLDVEVRLEGGLELLEGQPGLVPLGVLLGGVLPAHRPPGGAGVDSQALVADGCLDACGEAGYGLPLVGGLGSGPGGVDLLQGVLDDVALLGSDVGMSCASGSSGGNRTEIETLGCRAYLARTSRASGEVRWWTPVAGVVLGPEFPEQCGDLVEEGVASGAAGLPDGEGETGQVVLASDYGGAGLEVLDDPAGLVGVDLLGGAQHGGDAVGGGAGHAGRGGIGWRCIGAASGWLVGTCRFLRVVLPRGWTGCACGRSVSILCCGGRLGLAPRSRRTAGGVWRDGLRPCCSMGGGVVQGAGVSEFRLAALSGYSLRAGGDLGGWSGDRWWMLRCCCQGVVSMAWALRSRVVWWCFLGKQQEEPGTPPVET